MEAHVVTTLAESPEQDQSRRMRNYVITMSVRLACLLAMPFVQGWWLALCALGAIVLPYIAVVAANAVGPRPGGEFDRPGALEPYRGPADQRAGQPADQSGAARSAADPAADPAPDDDEQAR